MPAISRSALETLFECEQKRFFNYDFNTKGLVSTRSLFDTDIGIALHDALYECMMSEGETRYTHKAELSTEDNVMIEGLATTFRLDILPSLLDQYDIVSLEQEWTVAIPKSDYTLNMRMDAILRHKASGQLEILDYKTKKALGWIRPEQYLFNLQTALYTWALEEKTQEAIRGITYIVFEKGEVKLDRSKTFAHRIRHSPYCYGFKSQHGAYQATWAKGWEKFQTWTAFTPEQWVTNVMTQEERAKTFMVIPELQLDKAVRQTMIENAVKKEHAYQAKTVFERNHQACNKFGTEYQCPYFKLCWQGHTPLEEDFTERVDHHREED